MAPSVAVCTVAPAAWLSLSGVFAIGMLVLLPAELTVRHSAPPSTELLSTTMSAPIVKKLIPLATVSVVAPGVLFVPLFEEATRHMEQGVTLARRIGRPYLEFTGRVHQAAAEQFQSFARAAERGRQAVGLAERHGWTDDPAAGAAYAMLGAMLVCKGGPGRASPGSSGPSAPSEPKPSPWTR